jgi:hypothetical protein
VAAADSISDSAPVPVLGVRARCETHLPDFDDPDVRARLSDWIVDYWGEHGRWPTGREVGTEFEVHQATGRRWIASVKNAA